MVFITTFSAGEFIIDNNEIIQELNNDLYIDIRKLNVDYTSDFLEKEIVKNFYKKYIYDPFSFKLKEKNDFEIFLFCKDGKSKSICLADKLEKDFKDKCKKKIHLEIEEEIYWKEDISWANFYLKDLNNDSDEEEIEDHVPFKISEEQLLEVEKMEEEMKKLSTVYPGDLITNVELNITLPKILFK